MAEPDGTSKRPWIGSATVLLLFLLVAGGQAAASHTQTLSGDPTTPWVVHIQLMDDALKTRDVTAALRAWHDAHVSAIGSRQWLGMIEVGDAYLRIGQAAGTRRAAEAKAREAYLTALFRARQQRALDGVLRTAEAFAALGDRETVEQCIRVAERLATREPNPEARDRVRAFAAQLTDRILAAEATGRRSSVAP